VDITVKYDLEDPKNYDPIKALVNGEKARAMKELGLSKDHAFDYACERIGMLCILPPTTGEAIRDYLAEGNRRRAPASEYVRNLPADGLGAEKIEWSGPTHTASVDGTMVRMMVDAVKDMQIGDAVRFRIMPMPEVRSWQAAVSNVVRDHLHWPHSKDKPGYMTHIVKLEDEKAYLIVKRLA
jgi:hypothetical protein